MSTRRRNATPAPLRDSESDRGTSQAAVELRANLDSLILFKIARLGIARELATAAFIEPRYGLNSAELKVLLALRVGPMTMIQLSRETRLDKAWVSRSAYGLVERKIVSKSAMPADGRAVLLELTTAGRKLMQGIIPILKERENRLLVGLEKDHVVWLLDTLLTRLEKMHEKPPFG